MDVFKKVPVPKESGGDQRAEVTAVMLEPLPGHSDEEVVSTLQGLGAADVTILAPGFISAQVNRAALKAIESIAHVHPKTTKQMRFA